MLLVGLLSVAILIPCELCLQLVSHQLEPRWWCWMQYPHHSNSGPDKAVEVA